MEDTGAPARAVVGRGARAVEARLLDDIAALAAAARNDPTVLARPAVVIVPSDALRQHVASAVVRRLGGAATGVTIQRLAILADELLRRAGHRPPAGDALFEVLARREAAREPALARVLGDFDEGFGVAVASVRDLLSAGCDASLRVALEDAAQRIPARDEQELALALIRAALRTREAMDRAGVGRRADRLVLAARCLAGDPGLGRSLRAVFIHGFSDAPGSALELLRALLEHAPATVYLDEPPDPAGGGEPDAGAVIARRFAAALGLIPLPPAIPEPPNPEATPGSRSRPRLAAVHAPGVDAEIREIAIRLRSLLDTGEAPETIAVVARHRTSYIPAVRRHFAAFGIPFSGGSAPGAFFPEGRRLQAVMEVLRSGGRATTDRWLEALGPTPPPGFFEAPGDPGLTPGPGILADLRLGLRACGAARLNDVARLDVRAILGAAEGLPLPVRRGLEEIAADDEPENRAPNPRSTAAASGGRRTRGVMAHRHLPGSALRGAVRRAAALLGALAAGPEEASLPEHLTWLRRVAATDLGLDVAESADRGPGLGLGAALAAMAALNRDGLTLTRAEFLLLLGNAIAGQAWGPLGGAGAGVQVLDVAHARGRTFRHLFVIGANRGALPRPAREDPLLNDACRRALQSALPDLGLKGRSADEERYLFAQLLAAAEHRTISWQRADDDGRELPASPFIERLLLAGAVGAPDPVPGALAARLGPVDADGRPRPRLAREAAMVAALDAPRAILESLLPVALAEGRAALGTADGVGEQERHRVAQSRMRVLEEVDPDRRDPEMFARLGLPGPYLGAIGAVVLDSDPRSSPLSITTLENFARCPWQTFLVRLMRLEPPPDPLAALPAIDSRMLGLVVHDVLQQLVIDAMLARGGRAADLPKTIDDALKRTPVRMPRPAPTAIDAHLEAAAIRVGRTEGLILGGLHRALADRARPLVRRAIDLDWPTPDSTVTVLGAEIDGTAMVVDRDGTRRGLAFRADRVDLIRSADAPATALRLTDYKTGTPFVTQKRENTRAAALVAKVQEGTRLQAAAYAASRPKEATGRYLFLDSKEPDPAPEAQQLVVGPDHPALVQAFPEVVATLIGAVDDGAFFPRLADSDGRQGAACRECLLRAACLQEDSGSKRRLSRLAEAASAASTPAAGGKDARTRPPFLSHLANLWFLERPRGRPDGTGPRTPADPEEARP